MQKCEILIENGDPECKIHSWNPSGGLKAPGRAPPSECVPNFGSTIRSQGPSGGDFGRILAPQGLPEMLKIHQKSQKRGFEKRVDFRTSFWEAPGRIFHGFWSPNRRFLGGFSEVFQAQMSKGKNTYFFFFSAACAKARCLEETVRKHRIRDRGASKWIFAVWRKCEKIGKNARRPNRKLSPKKLKKE